MRYICLHKKYFLLTRPSYSFRICPISIIVLKLLHTSPKIKNLFSSSLSSSDMLLSQILRPPISLGKVGSSKKCLISPKSLPSYYVTSTTLSKVSSILRVNAVYLNPTMTSWNFALNIPENKSLL